MLHHIQAIPIPLKCSGEPSPHRPADALVVHQLVLPVPRRIVRLAHGLNVATKPSSNPSPAVRRAMHKIGQQIQSDCNRNQT